MSDPAMADWHTLPGWTTAHRLEQYGSLGAIRLWVTECGREYRTPDQEVDDEPLAAPDDMPRCKLCVVRASEERAGQQAEGGQPVMDLDQLRAAMVEADRNYQPPPEPEPGADRWAHLRNAACPHGIVRGMLVCPACDPEEQAAAEASVRAAVDRARAEREES